MGIGDGGLGLLDLSCDAEQEVCHWWLDHQCELAGEVAGSENFDFEECGEAVVSSEDFE